MSIRYSIAIACLAFALHSSSSVTFGQETPAAPPVSPVDMSSPEASLKVFMKAMQAADLELIKSVCVPHEELEVLTGSGRRPKEMGPIEPVIERLQVGETVKLPRGNTITIDDTMVTDSRAQLKVKGYPLPFDMVKVENEWKVNAQPMIAARKAARAAQQKK